MTPPIPALAIVLAMSFAPSAQAQGEDVATVDGVTPVAAFGGRGCGASATAPPATGRS